LLDPSKAAGDLYSPLIVSPESIASRASSSRVLRQALELTRKLSDDPYTEYVAEYYARGIDVVGDDWGFMDIVSVLYAVAEMGQPENYLEIGVRRGRSACVVAAASPKTDLYAFDMWQEDYANNENPGPEFVRQELRKFGFAGKATFVDGDSHKTVPQFFDSNPGLTFDLVTVDGDHSLEGARDDLQNVAARLRVGGVLVFDDTANPYCPGLDRVWSEFLQTNPGLRGFSYNNLGAGVSFALRVRESSKTSATKRRFWK
jgi:predicted O-methyltransferase YrrM